MMYTIPIKDIDIKKYVDFSSVFSKAKEGSQVDLGQKYANKILDLLNQKGLLPINLNTVVQLTHCAIQEGGVDINFLFLKNIIVSYFKNKQDVLVETKGVNLIINFRGE